MLEVQVDGSGLTRSSLSLSSASLSAQAGGTHSSQLGSTAVRTLDTTGGSLRNSVNSFSYVVLTNCRLRMRMRRVSRWSLWTLVRQAKDSLLVVLYVKARTGRIWPSPPLSVL